MINLDTKQFVIFGLRGSGKSVLSKSILATTESHLVYDPLREYGGFRRYLPTDRQSETELNEAIHKWVLPYRPRLFIIDEANKYMRPKPHPLPSGVADLNDLGRHWNISFGTICRRPTQFHTDITELADYLFIFHLPGKNDYKYLESLISGLGDTVRELPQYHFALVEAGKRVTVHAPIDISTIQMPS